MRSCAHQQRVEEGAMFARSSPELDVVTPCCVVINPGLVVTSREVRNDFLLGAQKVRSI
jgi:hypothetical protein